MAGEKERFEILMEDLKKDFKAAFEGVAALRSEMNRGFSEAKDQLRLVDGKVEHLGAEVRKIKKELGGVKEELGGVKEELGGVKEELAGVKRKVDKIEMTLDAHVKQPVHA